MQVNYVVHSAVEGPIPALVSMGGHDVVAAVPGLTVEMVSTDGPEHGHTFRFIPHGDDDMKAHHALFAAGNKVKATFEGVA